MVVSEGDEMRLDSGCVLKVILKQLFRLNEITKVLDRKEKGSKN